MFGFCISLTWYYFTITDDTCFQGPVPILDITAHQTTIRGEVISFTCLFGGHYSPDTAVMYYIYWEVSQDGKILYIADGTNHTVYQLLPPSPYYNDSDSNNFCNFVSELKINTSVVSDDVSVSCNALTDNQPSKSLSSSLSEFVIKLGTVTGALLCITCNVVVQGSCL